jgi:hypothetical protein
MKGVGIAHLNTEFRAVLDDFGAGAVKTIGTLEILAMAGLILPAALDTAPVLVSLAAIGVVLPMIGATIVCLRRYETRAIVVNLAVLALGALVARGRFGTSSPSPG